MSRLYISLCQYMQEISRDKKWWQNKIDKAEIQLKSEKREEK